MKKVQMYVERLKTMEDWEEFLLQESGLPGPRSNLELIQAVAATGSEEKFLSFIGNTPDKAPVNSQEEFLAACGTVGLGRLVSEGKTGYISKLRTLASDPRWRIREAVAMALQLYGEEHMDTLLDEMKLWSQGNYYEKRAAAAALCEPRLLGKREQVKKVLEILDSITEAITRASDRKDEGFDALKKGMAYCWSVAIVYNPEDGRRMFEKWFSCSDKDVIWIIKENLKKDRLKRMDGEWVLKCGKIMGMKGMD